MKCFCLGIIGNFSGHLSGAEKVEESQLPTGLFAINGLNEDLVTAGDSIRFPNKGSNIQAEPEFVLKFDVAYDNGLVTTITPKAITVGNDMTIRKLEGATKIDARKAWDKECKGLASHWWDVSDLNEYNENFKLVSVVKRDGEYKNYTPIAAPSELKIFYQEMCDWMVDTLNNQKSEGICSNMLESLKEADFPEEIIVFCGAPNYTDWGTHNFIQPEDEIFIAMVNTQKAELQNVVSQIQMGNVINDESVISYTQKVV